MHKKMSVFKEELPTVRCAACFSAPDMFTKSFLVDSRTKAKFAIVTGLDPADNLHVCHICCSLLRKYFEFRNMCIKWNNILSTMDKRNDLQNDVKPSLVRSEVHTTSYVRGESDLVPYSMHIAESLGVWRCGFKLENCEKDFDVKSDISYDSSSDSGHLCGTTNGARSHAGKKIDISESRPNLEGTEYESKKTERREKSRPKNFPSKIKRSEARGRRPKYLDGLNDLNMRLVRLTDAEQMDEIAERRSSMTFVGAAFKCERCATGFAHKETYDIHLAKHDASHGDSECEICGIRFSNVRTYWSHRTNHRKRFECVLCARRIKERRNCDSHVVNCPKRTADGCGVACDICGKVKSNEYTMKMHRARAHFARRNHACHLCAKMFVNVQALREHLVVHSGERPLSCDTCAATFATRACLLQHMSVHAVSKNFYCATCDLCFATQRRFKQHLSVGAKHLTPDKLKHKCAQCPRRYLNSFDLRLHTNRVHLSIRPYSCPECPLSYAAPNALAMHTRRKHPERASAGGAEPRAIKDKQFICDVCGSTFSAKTLLTCHMRRHTGERPLECSYCGARFAYPAARYTHIRLVHLKVKRAKKHCKDRLALTTPS